MITIMITLTISIKLSLNENGEDNAKITVMMLIITTDIKLMISNGNRTAWSTIQGALIGPVDHNSLDNNRDEYNEAQSIIKKSINRNKKDNCSDNDHDKKYGVESDNDNNYNNVLDITKTRELEPGLLSSWLDYE